MKDLATFHIFMGVLDVIVSFYDFYNNNVLWGLILLTFAAYFFITGWNDLKKNK